MFHGSGLKSLHPLPVRVLTRGFFRVETRGDCALAVKGGKPQPIFELKIDLETWTVSWVTKALGRLGSRVGGYYGYTILCQACWLDRAATKTFR
jgi:hypothetical protein